MNAELFAYWYISVFLIAFGATAIVACRYLGKLTLMFLRELRDPVIGARLRALLERRQELEGLGGRPMLIAGASYLFFGVLCLLHVVTPAVAYALACVDSALILAASFSRVRNTGEKRAASLSPRTLTTAVPIFGYLGAAVNACLPLALAGNGPLRFAAILVFAASTTAIVAAWWTSSMAAVLVGDDVTLELYVDERIRRSRVSSMLALAYAIVPVFFALATPVIVIAPAVVASLALTFSYIAWLAVDRIRGRLPRRSHGASV